MTTYWSQTENATRGDSPHWQPKMPTEAQQQAAILHAVQSRMRMDAELTRLQAEREEHRRKLKAEREKDSRPGEDKKP